MVTSSLRACLTSRMMRIILMPPPVEPAEVTNADSNSMVSGANSGQDA
ncbi:Uncharacterised protein [Bordetella pertussis]|nr:Uncharacterised protein [Bordetella pertussis]